MIDLGFGQTTTNTFFIPSLPDILHNHDKSRTPLYLPCQFVSYTGEKSRDLNQGEF